MKNTTRKHIWPVSLVMGLAVIGALAVIVALTALPGSAQAQDGPSFPALPDAMIDDGIASSSTSSGAGVKLTLTIGDPGRLVSGSSIELYLEDDFQVPDEIDERAVYFVGSGGVGRVYVTRPIEIDDDDHFGGGDDWSIQVQVPDMNPDNDTGFDAWSADDAEGLQLVFTKAAGIKNPTEAGTHSVGYSVLGPGDSANDGPDTELGVLTTYAKISLSADDGGRGKELTITGTGFNNDTGAEVRVYVSQDEPDCQTVMLEGEKLGEASVGKDDKFTLTINVHQDEFDGGAGTAGTGVNWICAADAESGNPRLAQKAKPFELTPTVSVDPSSGSYGDEITLKARDFGGELSEITLGPTKKWTNDGNSGNDDFDVDIDGSDYVFDLPGGLDAVIQVAAKGPDGSPRKTTTLTVEPSSLDLSKSEVVANESIIINGEGFANKATIDVEKVTIDGEPLLVDEAGVDNGKIQIDSNGDFVIEARVWSEKGRRAESGNPALDPDEYTIKIVDSTGFEGEAKVTILEPTVSVNPEVAGPRDYITVSGMNWPVSTEDDDLEVDITVDGKTRSANIDTSGRFSYQFRLGAGIDLGEEHDVTVTFIGYGGDVEEEATFNTPTSGITVVPAAARPGETISLELTGMPVFQVVKQVRIAGGNRLGSATFNTDRDGNATVTDVLVPAADPGHYSVQVTVGDGNAAETAVAQLEILSDAPAAGTATALPDAASELGDNLDAIFHFNNSTKAWTFFDPRPEFADLNTLTELINGQPYWVLVKGEQTGVDWNGRTVNFTCAAGDCWNLEIW